MGFFGNKLEPDKIFVSDINIQNIKEDFFNNLENGEFKLSKIDIGDGGVLGGSLINNKVNYNIEFLLGTSENLHSLYFNILYSYDFIKDIKRIKEEKDIENLQFILVEKLRKIIEDYVINNRMRVSKYLTEIIDFEEIIRNMPNEINYLDVFLDSYISKKYITEIFFDLLIKYIDNKDIKRILFLLGESEKILDEIRNKKRKGDIKEYMKIKNNINEIGDIISLNRELELLFSLSGLQDFNEFYNIIIEEINEIVDLKNKKNNSINLLTINYYSIKNELELGKLEYINDLKKYLENTIDTIGNIPDILKDLYLTNGDIRISLIDFLGINNNEEDYYNLDKFIKEYIIQEINSYLEYIDLANEEIEYEKEYNKLHSYTREINGIKELDGDIQTIIDSVVMLEEKNKYLEELYSKLEILNNN